MIQVSPVPAPIKTEVGTDHNYYNSNSNSAFSDTNSECGDLIISSNKPPSDSGSKKDSGLESGEVSDASEDPQPVKQQMVSVLKNPSSAVTETESNLENEISPVETKPVKKKLNLAEYRSRRDKNSDGSRSTLPIQPMSLMYQHHVATTTEPELDGMKNLVWAQMELSSYLKPKIEIEEEKNRPKPPTKEVGVQTGEAVFALVESVVEKELHHVNTAVVKVEPDYRNILEDEEDSIYDNILEASSKLEESKIPVVDLEVEEKEKVKVIDLREEKEEKEENKATSVKPAANRWVF